MGKARVDLGKRGEDIAVAFLQNKGYRIITRNFRSPLGEIDVVAEERKVKVFVEVKTRTSLVHGLPEESITEQKKQHMVRAALMYLKQKGWGAGNYRFDVVAIVMGAGGKAKSIELIKDAFETGAQYG